MSIRHTLAAALAVSAIAAPAASAMPSPPDMHASTAQAAAQERQDLRGEAARDAALHPRKAQAIDARGATAVDSQTRETPVAPGQPTWAVNPKPLPPPTSTQVAVTTSDDGIDWMSIGIGVAGSLLVLGGVAVLMSRTGRPPRAPFPTFPRRSNPMTIRRTLAAALAVSAIAAPSASAIPADTHASKAPAAQHQPVSQVLRSPGHPSEAGNTRPLPPLDGQVAKSDGLDWATIGLGIAGTLLAMGGIIALTIRRPVPRTRISV